jgi:5'-nucleotidase
MSTRRKFVKQTALTATAFIVAKPFSALAGSGSIFSGTGGGHNSISILHTADLSGQLSPVSDTSLYDGLGGVRNLASTVANLRERSSNIILADAGNLVTANVGQQEELNKLTCGMKYDAVFMPEAGSETIENNKGKLPLIDSSDANGQLRYRVIQRGKIRVAIISATAKSFFVADKLANQLKKQENCNLVVCLSSLGYNKKSRLSDITLAEKSTAIDVILGSGSQSFMPAPHIAVNKLKNEVIINHVGYGGIVLGKLDIRFNEDGQKQQVVFDNLMIGTPRNRWKRETA